MPNTHLFTNYLRNWENHLHYAAEHTGWNIFTCLCKVKYEYHKEIYTAPELIVLLQNWSSCTYCIIQHATLCNIICKKVILNSRISHIQVLSLYFRLSLKILRLVWSGLELVMVHDITLYSNGYDKTWVTYSSSLCKIYSFVMDQS